MSITEKIIHEARNRAGKRRVRKVAIGLSYTAVLLDDGSVGVAFSFANRRGPGTLEGFEYAGTLAGRPASELLPFWNNSIPVFSSIAVATVNSILAHELEALISVSQPVDDFYSRISNDDTVGLIGYFKPVVEKLRNRIKELRIFELNPPDEEPCFSPEEIPFLLPACSAVIITGTTLVNRTLDEILHHTGGKLVAIVGPTTIMLPSAYAGTPVNFLGGSLFTDGEKVLQVVMEGGGMKELKPLGKKINLVL